VPELKVISKYGVGLDAVDVDADRAPRRQAGWTGGVNRRSVSELTLAFAIALLHRVPEASALCGGHWAKVVGRQLTGRTVGIIGCGFVGQDLVKLLAPFGCRVLAHDIRDYPDFYRDHRVDAGLAVAAARESDIVTLHVPLDRYDEGMIGAAEIARMRQGSFSSTRRAAD
jgi:D-3-phosphoglycerate dehydrogenase